MTLTFRTHDQFRHGLLAGLSEVGVVLRPLKPRAAEFVVMNHRPTDARSVVAFRGRWNFYSRASAPEVGLKLRRITCCGAKIGLRLIR